MLKAIENSLDPESNADPEEELMTNGDDILNSIVEFTIDMNKGIKVKHVINPDTYEEPVESTN